jgi:hypothetical protein
MPAGLAWVLILLPQFLVAVVADPNGTAMADGGNFSEVPPVDGNFSEVGPYDEEPDDAEAEHPRPALANWSAASADTANLRGWGGSSSFCQTHHVGSFCQQYTRIRCCKSGWFYTQCGSTAHSTSCGWRGGPARQPYQPGYPGSSNPGWHPWVPSGGSDQFCESHRTGNFCSHHTRISCCKKSWGYGVHYVSCTTNTRSHSYC